MSSLYDLAAAAGLDATYHSWRGKPIATSDESIRIALAALGVDLGGGIDAAVRELERARWDEVVPPVCVGWDGALVVPFAVPAEIDADCEIAITLESGEVLAGKRGRLFDLPASDHAWPGGVVHCVRRATIGGIPAGYHAIAWRCGKASGESFAIVAPAKAFGGPGQGADVRGADVRGGASSARRWGVFAPVYGIATAASGETGDLATLAQLFAAVGARGGRYVATLPILAADLEPRAGERPAYSPYSPVSRLFWNDLYLDLAALARDAGLAPPVAPPVADRALLIDYAAQYAWRRTAYLPIAARLAGDPARAAAADAWATAHDAYDYAAFRALTEQHEATWRTWPAGVRDRAPYVRTRAEAIVLGAEAARIDAHVIAQHAMQRQLEQLDDDGPVSLYLDLPVGVSGDAYEVWRWRDQFLTALSAGAPPDALFLGGQNWGLPPLSPTAQRRDRYRYFIRCVRHHMRVAGMLRVDHVMGLFRLYCVPAGRPATDGVYLRYPADELMAILVLESHRGRCAIVGEDLGTVPDHVRPAMTAHGMFRLHVGQWALPARVGRGPEPSPREAVASLNTHDTATFAGWWAGADLADQRALGLITGEQEATERAKRDVERAAVLANAGARVPGLTDLERAMVTSTLDLAEGPAEVVLVALDDLTLEPVPHNVPGTTTERPNWHRRVARWAENLDTATATPAATAVLEGVARARPRS